MGQEIATKENRYIAPRDYAPAQLQLIKRTVAKDCNDDEFNMFIEICKRQGLDPFRRQIYAFVFNKDKPEKRQFVTVTGIDGYRAIAKRTGSYRPAEAEPVIEYDETKIDPGSNPKGIVKATVTVYQYGPDRQWYPVVGVARWEEFAPIDSEYDLVDKGETWPDGNKKKTRVPNGKKKLAKENWQTMPHVMISKCAEAQALRKGWPEEFGGLYTFDEMDRVIIDMTAAEEIRQFEQEERIKKVGGFNSYPLILEPRDGLQMIEAGKMADTIIAYVKTLPTSTEVNLWLDQNRQGMNQYWARQKAEALEVKSSVEKIAASKPAPIEQPQAAE